MPESQKYYYSARLRSVLFYPDTVLPIQVVCLSYRHQQAC